MGTPLNPRVRKLHSAVLLWPAADGRIPRMEDAIIKEVREVRRQIEEEFGHDVAKYLDHVYEAQKTQGDRLVHRQPKPAKRHKGA